MSEPSAWAMEEAAHYIFRGHNSTWSPEEKVKYIERAKRDSDCIELGRLLVAAREAGRKAGIEEAARWLDSEAQRHGGLITFNTLHNATISLRALADTPEPERKTP
jgi:hypothetical protein